MENLADVGNSEILIGVGLTLWVLKEISKVLKPYLIKKKDSDYSHQESQMMILNEIKQTNTILIEMGKRHEKLASNQAEQMDMIKDIKRMGEKDHSRIDTLKDNTNLIASETSTDAQRNIEAHNEIKEALTGIRVQLAGGK